MAAKTVWKISASVGKTAVNKPVDIAIVQDLLNYAGLSTAVDGTYDPSIDDLIRSFQSNSGSSKPDGQISAGGPTFKKLLAGAGPAYPGPYCLTTDPNTTWSILSTDFAVTFARQFPDRARTYNYTVAHPVGLRTVFSKICKDPDITDYRWMAYMLATCQCECPSFVPISEWGKGAGHPYGTPEIFTASDGKKYTNTYYGRGYVQLTWGRNYLALGKAIGTGEQLAINADLALDPDTAYKVMSYGMRNGSFTTRKLGDFINGQLCDYHNARTIINGHNRASEIADCALQIQRLIQLLSPRLNDGPSATCIQTAYA